jgi:DNA modification methylase
MEGQIGLEPTPELYVARLVEVFRAVRRVLRDDGTAWLNLGDSYATIAGTGRAGTTGLLMGGVDGYKREVANKQSGCREVPPGLKPKDLIGIPWRVAFALQADGWYLRSDIIWAKPNPMPESVTDRPTKSHEYVFLLAKQERYYYDAEAIKEGMNAAPDRRLRSSTFKKVQAIGHALSSAEYVETIGRNRRSVWTIPTRPEKAAHFAVMPTALVKPCLLAGCREGGTVLDPFVGAGTVPLVAYEHNREAIGIDLNPKYLAIARRRLARQAARYALFEPVTG